MSQKIERDHQRFKKIVRGKVKSNLGKYISRGEMIGKKGDQIVSIPVGDGDVRLILGKPGVRYQSPAYSPDGKHIVALQYQSAHLGE